MISVLILTRNEQQDLPACLDSVSFSDDVHVFDSTSTDNTCNIARARGAHVTQRPFDSYAKQRNAALRNLPFKHEWLFILDADERPTPELAAEMQLAATTAPANIAGFRLQRRDFLWGTWLKHAQITPLYIRLVRHKQARYEREINEVITVDGNIADLHNYLDHFPFSKGIAHWVAKHNVYSTMEAALIASGTTQADASLSTALFAKDFHQKRAAQKALFFKLPARPLLKWLYMMFFRGAILDGAAGLAYATLQSFYEYLIVLKTRELRTKK